METNNKTDATEFRSGDRINLGHFHETELDKEWFLRFKDDAVTPEAVAIATVPETVSDIEDAMPTNIVDFPAHFAKKMDVMRDEELKIVALWGNQKAA